MNSIKDNYHEFKVLLKSADTCQISDSLLQSGFSILIPILKHQHQSEKNSLKFRDKEAIHMAHSPPKERDRYLTNDDPF